MVSKPMAYSRNVTTTQSLYQKMLYDKNQSQPWESWFAWKPVKANNKWVWCRKIYRRRQYSRLLLFDEGWEWTYTANIFEILKGID